MSTPAHIPYTIVGQDYSTELAPNGAFVDVWNVHFTSPSGTNGTVRIPAASYNPAVVDKAIQDQLALIEGVHALGPAPYDLGE